MIVKNVKSVGISTPAATTPISLTELKAYLKIDGIDEDTILTMHLNAAVDAAQRYTRRYFINTTLDFWMDSFANEYCDNKMSDFVIAGTNTGYKGSLYHDADIVYLPHIPAVSVTSIRTYDKTNTATTYNSANYTLDDHTGRIFLNDGATWPTDLRATRGVKIIYVAGYGASASDVPAAIRHAILEHAGKMYQCKGACEMTDHCKESLRAYKLYDAFGW